MKYRVRVRGYQELPGSRILPNPKNWRTHGGQQRDVLRGMLAEVGVADAVLVRPVDPAALDALRKVPQGDTKAFAKWAAGYQGDYMLMDGHLRADEIRDQPVPALILDCDDDEADKVLATLDPIAGLAGMDREMFRSLTQDLTWASPAVGDFAAMMAQAEARMQQDASSVTGNAPGGSTPQVLSATASVGSGSAAAASGEANDDGNPFAGPDEGGAPAADKPPPEDFPEFGEDIETEHKCPKCGYRWSGKAA